MNFGLSEEQQLLTDSVSSFLSKEVPLHRVRQFIERGEDKNLHNQLAELGIAGIIIPEELGGSGLGYFEAALLSELFGQNTTPGSFISTSVIAPTLLASSDQSPLLREIADGTIEVGFGYVEDLVEPNKQGKISHNFSIVMGFGANYFLLCDATGNVYLIDEQDLTNTQTLTTIDQTRRIGSINCIDLPCIKIQANRKLLEKALNAGRTMLAADTLGAAQHMLDAAVGYAKERQQFGQLIGSFQAVKHMCAEMSAILEPCRAFLWFAAHKQDSTQGGESTPDCQTLACQLKAHLDEVGQSVARTATEVHGGIGFTDLLGLHLWFKRIGFNRQNLGSPTQLRALAAQIQGFGG